MATVQFNKKNW